MNNLNCNVIRDLIPSYVDEICSKDSKEIVEEHLTECKECKKLVTMMNVTEIVENQTNIDEIDYMKKVKRHFIRKNIISLCLLIGFIIIGMGILLKNSGHIPLNLYYIILPVLSASSYFILSDYSPQKSNKKWEILISILSIAFAGYCIILEFLIVNWGKRGIYPFGMDVNEVGPFVWIQLIIITFFQIAIFIGSIIVSLKTESINSVLLGISLTGGCLALAFISMLMNAESIESFIMIRNRSLFVILLEGILMIGITSYLNKKESQKGEDNEFEKE